MLLWIIRRDSEQGTAAKYFLKQAGISSNYYLCRIFRHQTQGDALLPLAVVTVTQPWQRSKLLDYVKRCRGTLLHRIWSADKMGKDRKEFRQCQDNKAGTIRIQPQISLWDPITGLSLKVAIKVAQDFGLDFKHSWQDHTTSHRDTHEYLLWANFLPENGEKSIRSVNSFCSKYPKKFDDLFNGAKNKGKGKGKTGHETRQRACLPPFDARSAFERRLYTTEPPIGSSCGKKVATCGKVFWRALLPFVLPDSYCRKNNQTSTEPRSPKPLPQDSQESRWAKCTKPAQAQDSQESHNLIWTLAA